MASTFTTYILILVFFVALSTTKITKEIEIVGPCVNNECPHSYTCNRNECIREKQRARSGSSPIGPCINTHCPVGHLCVDSENQCYPTA